MKSISISKFLDLGTHTSTLKQPAGLPDDVTERNPKKKGYVDPWLLVCSFCPLPDCVRVEGEIQPQGANFRNERIQDCPVYQANKLGWDAYEAIANRNVLGLLKTGKDIE